MPIYNATVQRKLIIKKPTIKIGEFVIQYNQEKSQIIIGVLCGFNLITGFDSPIYRTINDRSINLVAQWMFVKSTALSLNRLIAQADSENTIITKLKPLDIIIFKSRSISLGRVNTDMKTITKINSKGKQSNQSLKPNTQYVKVDDILENVL